MVKVFNLRTGEYCAEFDHDDAFKAVAYCEAEANKLMSLFFSLVHDNIPLDTKFTFLIGEKTISCGDYAARKSIN